MLAYTQLPLLVCFKTPVTNPRIVDPNPKFLGLAKSVITSIKVYIRFGLELRLGFRIRVSVGGNWKQNPT